MNLDQYIDQMARQAQSIHQLAQGFSDEQARWKPDADTWSVLEVMNHLYFEECADFRDHLIRSWNLAPVGREFDESYPYDTDDAAAALAAFMDEREKSLAWLRTLQAPDWTAICQLQSRQISAGDMLVSWVTHDILHLRQLTELHYAHTKRDALAYDITYAGEW